MDGDFFDMTHQGNPNYTKPIRYDSRKGSMVCSPQSMIKIKDYGLVDITHNNPGIGTRHNQIDW